MAIDVPVHFCFYISKYPELKVFKLYFYSGLSIHLSVCLYVTIMFILHSVKFSEILV